MQKGYGSLRPLLTAPLFPFTPWSATDRIYFVRIQTHTHTHAETDAVPAVSLFLPECGNRGATGTIFHSRQKKGKRKKIMQCRHLARGLMLDAKRSGNMAPANWETTTSFHLPAVVIVVVEAKNQRSVLLAAASLIGPSWWLIAMQRKPQIPGSFCRQPYLPALSQSMAVAIVVVVVVVVAAAAAFV